MRVLISLIECGGEMYICVTSIWGLGVLAIPSNPLHTRGEDRVYDYPKQYPFAAYPLLNLNGRRKDYIMEKRVYRCGAYDEVITWEEFNGTLKEWNKLPLYVGQEIKEIPNFEYKVRELVIDVPYSPSDEERRKIKELKRVRGFDELAFYQLCERWHIDPETVC